MVDVVHVMRKNDKVISGIGTHDPATSLLSVSTVTARAS
jgi:hypothetical protein